MTDMLLAPDDPSLLGIPWANAGAEGRADRRRGGVLRRDDLAAELPSGATLAEIVAIAERLAEESLA